VPPRLFLPMLEEGSFSDEDVIVEYLGGVLASSRTPGGKDDRGVVFASLVNRMSSPQLRLHYLVYRVLRAGVEAHEPLETVQSLMAAKVFLPDDVLQHGEIGDGAMFTHAVYGLDRESLITGFGFGPSPAAIADWFPQAPAGGLAVNPTRGGVELFVWGLGHGPEGLASFLTQDVDFAVHDLDLSIPEGSMVRFGPDDDVVLGGLT
jgi:hypothetical protein